MTCSGFPVRASLAFAIVAAVFVAWPQAAHNFVP